MSALRFGLIGAGAIAQAYLQAFSRLGEVARLVAVADVRPEAATALAESVGAKAVAGHEALLRTTQVDAVIVCTPPASHEAIALDCLHQGVAVLCEKPLSLSLASARRMVDCAEAEGVTLAMASKFRHTADMIRARSLLTSGAIGEVLQVENAFTARVDMAKRWNADPAVSGGGVLIDNGTHSVDILRFLFGPIAEVLVVDGPRRPEVAVEETVQLFTRSERGVLGRIDLSWRFQKTLPTFLDVYGTDGVLQVGWRESRYKSHTSPDWTVFGAGYDKVASFVGVLQDFCASLSDDVDPLIQPQDALASVAVIEAAYRSLREGGWQKVEAR